MKLIYTSPDLFRGLLGNKEIELAFKHLRIHEIPAQGREGGSEIRYGVRKRVKLINTSPDLFRGLLENNKLKLNFLNSNKP